MLWLALEFPHLGLDALGDTQPTVPLAICEPEGSRRRIVDCNAAAQACGIRAGMALGAAHALSADLRVCARRPQDERAALIRRATWALRYTPMVGLRGEACLLLELAASCSLFGGLRTLLARIGKELATAGYDCRAAVAPSPAAALLLARADLRHAIVTPRRLRSVLREIALAHAELPPATIAALAGIGVHSVGRALALPRAELGRRFGQATVAWLDRVLGTRNDPVERFHAPQEFHAELELPSPVHEAAVLAFGGARLLRELGDWLQARQLAVQRYTLDLHHHGHAITPLEIGLRLASAAHEHLVALLRARLEHLRLPGAVHALVLRAPECAPLRGANADLFDRAGQVDEDAERLLERLRSRLGPDAVLQLRLRADHRPEFAGERKGSEPFSRSRQTETTRPITREKGSDPFLSSSPPRPLYLLDPPQPLEHWPGMDIPGLVLCGPERIESGWWDEHGVRRDYFRARTRDGTTYWLFHERQGWFVHGLFA